MRRFSQRKKKKWERDVFYFVVMGIWKCRQVPVYYHSWSGRRRRTIPYLSVRFFFFFFADYLFFVSLSGPFFWPQRLKKKAEENNIPTLKRNPNTPWKANTPCESFPPTAKRSPLYIFQNNNKRSRSFFSPLLLFFLSFQRCLHPIAFPTCFFFPLVTFAQIFFGEAAKLSWDLLPSLSKKKSRCFFFAVDANRTWNTFDVLLVGSPQVTSACSSFNAFHSRSPPLSLYWSILSSAERCKLHNRARGYFFQYVFVLLIFLPIKKKRWWMSFTACCFLINHVINNCAT